MTVPFQEPTALLMLVLVPAVIALYLRAVGKRAASLSMFQEGHPSSPPAIRAARSRHRLHIIGVSVGLTFMILALARPGWRPRQDVLTKSGRDVVFVLDVSRSMLAEDRVPNRLENMRIAILDCVSGFRGNRVALAVFAGSTAIKCPLTSDYEFFEAALRDVSPRSTSHGGTRVGDALHKVIDKLMLDDMQGFQDVILITDGGDQDSRPGESIADLNAIHAGLVVIGVGAADRGVRIPIRDPSGGERAYVQHESRDVMTRQNGALLRGLVEACDNGLYLDAGTRPIDLANVHEQFAAHMDRRVLTTDNVEVYEEEFPVFVGVALLALLLSSVSPFLAARRLRRAAALLTAGCLVVSSQTATAGWRGTEAEARQAYEAGDVEKARDLFAAVCNAAPTQGEPHHNLGNALYRAGDYTNASASYVRALALTTRRDLQFRCCYNIGNCLVRTAECESGDNLEASSDQLAEAVRYYRAALAIRPDDEDAAWNLECALCKREKLEQQRRSQAAMDNKADQREESETSEGDSMQAADSEDDVVGEETDADTDALSAQPPSASSRALDLKSRSLPPPNVTPEEVLQEEEAINAIREKGSGQGFAKVEKDW